MKNKSIKNKIFASALALTLTIGAFQLPSYVANAAEPNTPQLKIKKVLNLPESGVSTPVENFTFKFEKHSLNNDENKKNELPDIQGKPAAFDAAMVTDADPATDGKQIVKLTDDVLKGVTFDKAGQYTYRVTEIKGAKDDMTYSSASYLVSIFTKTDEHGKVVVDSIQIKKEKDDEGNTVPKANKTPYTPGTEADNGKGNEFVFNNNYDPKDGNDNLTPGEVTPGKDPVIPEVDKKGFALMKEIAGANVNVHEKFTFKITADKPKGSHSDAQTFKCRVVSGKTVSQPKEETYGKPFDVDLKHGDRVVFSGVLLGSTVKAEETVDGGYTKGIKAGSKINGQEVNTVEKLKTGLPIGDDKAGNFVNFVNTPQTPTGILMNHLPFIALVLAAVSGILFFVKNKKEDENAQA